MATAATELEHAEREISTSELSRRLGEAGLAVVDVRPLPRFNGWRGPGEARGGHVPGAVALPAEWLSRLDADLQSLLRTRGSPRVPRSSSTGTARMTRSSTTGWPSNVAAPVRSLVDGWAEWAADEALPVERLARYERLVHYRLALRSCSPAAGRRQHRRDGTSSSTSTSAFPRSTRRAIFQARSTSTRTSSRARATGTVARRRRSMQPCARSGSPPTRR